ncbi:MAG: ABC transporter ATP-binding protein [Candidatus Bathyarchaeia archaeon]
MKSVHKEYGLKGIKVHALKNITLNVNDGDFVCIVGPSGSGKTTLLNLMGCLDTPTSGEVYIQGKPTHNMSNGELTRVRGECIGFVFQTFNLIPRITALRNVMLPMTFVRKFRKSEWRRRAEKLLSGVGLTQRMYHKPLEMSGGEMQRVAIARALANDPLVILADEPTGNLDSKTGKEIMELFNDLNKQGKTLIVVSHDPMVASYARKTIKLEDGEIIGGG